jgi:flagellar biosynthesis chaperone FliJ
MNKERKNRIFVVNNRLNVLAEELRSIKEEEENYYDNIPENLQGSMRAEESEDIIDILDEVTEHIREVVDQLREI